MRRVMLSMLVKEGCEERFVDTWKAFAPRVGAQPGNGGQVMLRDTKDPRVFLIASDWRDEDSLKSFQESSLRRDLSSALNELRETARNWQFEVVARYGATEGEAT